MRSLVAFDRLARLGCRDAPDSASLFFASPKKSKQKKGDPAVCVPALRCGQPAVLGPAGVTCKLAALRQARALIRLALRSSAHTEGTFAVGERSPNFPGPDPVSPVLAGPVNGVKSGIRAARCLSAASLRRPPLLAPFTGCPKGPRLRVAFSLLTFFWRSKRK